MDVHHGLQVGAEFQLNERITAESSRNEVAVGMLSARTPIMAMILLVAATTTTAVTTTASTADTAIAASI